MGVGAAGALSLTGGTTYYEMLADARTGQVTAENQVQVTHRGADITLGKLTVYANANTCNATTTISVRKNASSTSQSVSFSASTSGTAVDSTHSDTITAGDKFNLIASPGGSGTFSAVFMSCECSYAGAALKYQGCVRAATTHVPNDAWFPAGNPLTGGVASVKLNTAGTIRNLFIRVSTADSANGAITVQLNGSNTGVTVSTVASTTGILEDTTHTASVAAGDVCQFKYTGGSGTISLAPESFQFLSSGAAADCIVALGNSPTRSANASARFIPILGGLTPAATESDAITTLTFPATASYLTLQLSANTYTGAVTVKSRKNGADGNQSLSISAGATGTFQDTSNSDSYAINDTIDISIIGGTANSGTIPYAGMLVLDASPVVVALTALVAIQVSARASASASAALAALANMQASSRTQPSGVAPILGRAAAISAAKAIPSGVAPISGRIAAIARAAAAPSGSVSLTGNATAQTKSRAVAIWTAVLSAIATTQSKASGQARGDVSLSAQAQSQARGAAAAAGTAALYARAQSQVRGAAAVAGSAALAGRAIVQAAGRAAISGTVQLAGRVVAQARATAAVTGVVALYGRAQIAARAVGRTTGVAALFGRAVTAFKAALAEFLRAKPAVSVHTVLRTGTADTELGTGSVETDVSTGTVTTTVRQVVEDI